MLQHIKHYDAVKSLAESAVAVGHVGTANGDCWEACGPPGGCFDILRVNIDGDQLMPGGGQRDREISGTAADFEDAMAKPRLDFVKNPARVGIGRRQIGKPKI